MKKRLRLSILLWVLGVLAIAQFASASAVNAVRTESRIYLNDQSVSIAGYNINGNNYFKLRDLANALKDTASCFDVTWNEAANQVELITQQAYTGGASEYGWSAGSPVQAVPSTAQLMVDGKLTDIAAYNINGNNYYKLRDLAEWISYHVEWLAEENSVCIYTGVGEHAQFAASSGGARRQLTVSESTARWSHINRSYLCDNGDGTFLVVDVRTNSNGETVIAADTYDSSTYELRNTKTIPMELETFGGFYAGERCNYMVFGQQNTEENDRKEVIRVVKYDKQFNRLDSASVTGGDSYTVQPFDAGSLRMAEHGDELVIHTSRKRYTTEDGLNHQSQLTIRLDTDTMRVQNDLGRFQANHVSHSFNQFVQYDGSQHVLVDHGDAYPRSVVLSKSSGSSYTTVDLFDIPGPTGANCTGVTVGGLAVSDSSYLVAINTVDHSKVTGYSSFNLTGLTQDERDVVLLVCGKSSSRASQVKQVTLTDYIGGGKLGSTPYLVPLDGDRFLVLWEEFEYPPTGTTGGAADRGIRYVVVDGAGTPLTGVSALPDAQLSSDCQPVCVNGQVVWYINAKAGRIFYQISV